jgi:hypothetical protein
MKRIAAGILVASVFLFAAVQPASAHHSTGMFDFTKPVIYKGTITKIDWMNPHVFLYIDARKTTAPPGSPIEKWALEGPTPNALMSSGRLMPDELKVGDTITVTGAPRKDGLPTMRIVTLTLSTGKTVNISG